MAENKNLEERAQEDPGKGAPQSGLEKKVVEKSFSKKFLDLFYHTAYATAATALSTALLGTTGVLVGGALGLGSLIGKLAKGEKLYDSLIMGIKNYSIVNTVIYPMVLLGQYTFPIFGALGAKYAGTVGAYAARTAYAVSLYNMAFNGLFIANEHLLDNYFNPKGMKKTFQKMFWPIVKRVSKVFSPGFFLDANGLSSVALGGLSVPVFALNALPAGYINNRFPVKLNEAKKESAEPKANPNFNPAYQPA